MEDEDYNLCEICYITFDKKIHIPKIVECCKNTFCIVCLKSLYQKKQHCPKCRTNLIKNPDSLKTDISKFEKITTACPSCNKQVKVNSLSVILDGDTKRNIFLYCLNCPKENQKNIYISKYSNLKLIDFLKNLKEEYDNIKYETLPFLNKLNLIDSLKGNKRADRELDSKINVYIDNFFEKMKRNLKVKLKNNMDKYLKEEQGIDINLENELNELGLETSNKFLIYSEKLDKIEDIKTTDVNFSNEAIRIYNKFTSINDNIEKINILREFINIISFNFSLLNQESFEDFLVNNIEIKQKEDILYSKESIYKIQLRIKDIYTGIPLIDKEFQKMKINYDEFTNELRNLTESKKILITKIKELKEDCDNYKAKIIKLEDDNNKLNPYLKKYKDFKKENEILKLEIIRESELNNNQKEQIKYLREEIENIKEENLIKISEY